MINIRNLVKGYEKEKVIDGINAVFKKGKITGLLGINGAGKTTMLKCLAGAMKPDKGKIRIDNVDIHENPDIKSRIGFIPEQGNIFNSYNMKKIKWFYSMAYPEFSKKRFDDINNIFKNDYRKRFRELSKGQKKKVLFMLAVSINPKVLILDEPLSGIDPKVRYEIEEILMDEAAKGDMAVIMSSHYIIELERICDRILILHEKKIKYDGTIENFKKEYAMLDIACDKDDLSNICSKFKNIRIVRSINKSAVIFINGYDKKTNELLLNNRVKEIRNIEAGLEELFVQFVKGDN